MGLEGSIMQFHLAREARAARRCRGAAHVTKVDAERRLRAPARLTTESPPRLRVEQRLHRLHHLLGHDWDAGEGGEDLGAEVAALLEARGLNCQGRAGGRACAYCWR